MFVDYLKNPCNSSLIGYNSSLEVYLERECNVSVMITSSNYNQGSVLKQILKPVTTLKNNTEILITSDER